MVAVNRAQLRQDLYEVQLRVNQLAGQITTILPTNITPLSPPTTNFFPAPVAVSPSAVNQIRNGEFGHSVNTWFEAAYLPMSDQNYECALWFSNDEPVLGQQLSENNSLTDPGIDNETLKFVGHPFYNPDFSDWDRENGLARFQGTTSIDAPFPSNFTKGNLTQYLGFLMARNADDYPTVTYHIPDNTILYAGIWDNTTGQLYWLPGVFDFTFSEVRGTPAVTAERRYKIFARTDRGYTFLSSELTIANAPTDASYATSDVYFTWSAVPGVLEYDIYRHNITAATYDLLDSIGNGSTAYSDDNHILEAGVAGYPTPTNSVPIAFVGTYPGDLEDVPVDGSPWVVAWLNIATPTAYNMSLTTDKQWLRMYLSNALDRSVSDIVATMGDATITSAIGSFTAQDKDRVATLTDEDGNELVTSIDAYTNATEVELTDPWPYPNATSVTIYIEEGGDHGLLIDVLHTSFVGRSAFAPNPEDVRELQPVAAPNGSSQGGPGGGGGIDPGGGGVGCVTDSTPIITLNGNSLLARIFQLFKDGDWVESGNLNPNQVLEKRPTMIENVHILRTANNIEVECSPSSVWARGRNDRHGQKLTNFMQGDSILTMINGATEVTTVKEIISTSRREHGGTFSLSPGSYFFAGKRIYTSRREKVIMQIKRLLGIKDIAGVAHHNMAQKLEQNPV